jgi:probable metal-binding protein
MNQIHGHEVMEMMLASGKTYTRESLIADILGKFGTEARFHTCSAENMTAEQLVAFLDDKGKLLPRDGGFQTSQDVMCQH